MNEEEMMKILEEERIKYYNWGYVDGECHLSKFIERRLKKNAGI